MTKLTKAQRSVAAKRGWRTRRVRGESTKAQHHSVRRARYRAGMLGYPHSEDVFQRNPKRDSTWCPDCEKWLLDYAAHERTRAHRSRAKGPAYRAAIDRASRRLYGNKNPFQRNPTPNSRIRDVLHGFSQTTLSKGIWTVRESFFYKFGGSSASHAERVRNLLAEEGIKIQVLDQGEHWTAFRGGASVAHQSHWWVKFVVV